MQYFRCNFLWLTLQNVADKENLICSPFSVFRNLVLLMPSFLQTYFIYLLYLPLLSRLTVLYLCILLYANEAAFNLCNYYSQLDLIVLCTSKLQCCFLDLLSDLLQHPTLQSRIKNLESSVDDKEFNLIAFQVI